jgi:hypothetical protein
MPSPLPRTLLATLIAITFICGGCLMKKPTYTVGGLYSIDDGEGRFRISKVLAIDGGAVHVRTYKNRFTSRPKEVDPSTLSLGSIDEEGGGGIGHLPLSPEGFTAWQPVFIMQSTVSEEELEGYRL